MNKNELEFLTKKIAAGEASKEETDTFLSEVGKLLDEVIAVAQ